MAAVRHKITIKRRDDDLTKELILEHEDTSGGDLGEIDNDVAVRINSGAKVSWTSQDPVGNYAVLFQEDSPFNGDVVALGGRAGEITLAKVAKRLGGTPTTPVSKSFKYAITVIETQADGTVTAKTIDPDLEVTDSSGGT
jgi:hypothetical protein